MEGSHLLRWQLLFKLHAGKDHPKAKRHMRKIIADFTWAFAQTLQLKRGITGLETAIVLIAFVVVASVFAFAVLSVGLFSADKSKETVQSGLEESTSTLELRGAVIARAGVTGDIGATVEEISFILSTAVAGQPVNLSPGDTVISYRDDTHSLLLESEEHFSVNPFGRADSDQLLEQGEQIKITLLDLVSFLTTGGGAALTTGDSFSLEVLPPQGAVLGIKRTVPGSLELFTELD